MAIALAAELLNVAFTLRNVLRTNSYDAIWISREIINGYPSFERFLKRPFVYDIDDAVFLRNPLILELIF